MTTSPDMPASVSVSRTGHALHVELRRPQALNALNLEMIEALDRAFSLAENDSSIALVILAGAGERAFCAGGDIRAIAQGLASGEEIAEPFWRAEYDLLRRIEAFAKPVVVLMDAIVMGGGVGLAMHASHRVVTERTRLAMPETGIGFLPDVGATWRLPQAPDRIGDWLALTGETVNADDAILAGLADAMVSADRLSALRTALSELPLGVGSAEVGAAIVSEALPAPAGRLRDARALIAAAFADGSLETIMERLRADDRPFARETLATLATRSPASLYVTRHLLERGARSPDLAACLERELASALRIHREADFREGVRAALIDKDRDPRWAPWTPERAADWDAFLDDFDRRHAEGQDA
ncbi:enoyl-CoA hydratase/isomerase family protein [Aureimonas pseudogalii]|uniref:3-hydroxyisobutyryl-CoA hydrolase n=1 Tax=Aureimonas pseudogalii TaxID=1744844 RepID=A0A7W6EB24_9HYPH|nr:enoyl-CoA hydratase/isomerase family protein [Aureimonas pseudogalii]MBB3998061.1 enoyl-CoA hydratase [Aureimonas pseudogalii]